MTDRYQQGKSEAEFCNYDVAVLPTVAEFYKTNHKPQTLDFVLGKENEYFDLEKGKKTAGKTPLSAKPSRSTCRKKRPICCVTTRSIGGFRRGPASTCWFEHDEAMLSWVREFTPYDLYFKGLAKPNLTQLTPFNEDLIADFFPDKID